MIVLVSTFDERSFAWKPFVHGMNKYWHDCPWEVKWMTNKLEAPMGEAIKIPENSDWVYMMKRALEQIEDKTILFMIEDYWLTYPVLTKEIQEFYEMVENDQADYIKLMPSPDAQNPTIDKRLGEFNKDAMYRTSVNMSIWNTEVLYNLLDDNENIWQFETQAGKRLPESAVMLAVRDKIYMRIVEGEDGWESSSAVEQGTLTGAGRRYIREEEV